VLATATIEARVDGESRRLLEIRASSGEAELQRLLGAVVGPGFRSRVDETVPDERDAHSLLYLLLDDMPGAALVSGYALLHGDATPVNHHDEFLDAKADLCAGWASDATIMVTIRAQGRSPTPLGPPAPSLERPGDPVAWHTMSPLPPFGMRRQRRLDVAPPTAGDGDLHPVDVLFRDSHADADAVETVVHEYSVTATVDGRSRTIVSIGAAPDVLPWMECPAAAASATRLTGRGLAGLRPWVRANFVGTSTCTHLNDTLRSLTDVELLLDRLVPTAGRR
jgi:hypothetical protein